MTRGNRISKQFANDVVRVTALATCWHEVPMPPLEGEVPNEREAEGFVRKLSKKTPQSARSGCQLPQRGSRERSHSTGYSLNRGVTGDFHRPYETLNV